MEAITNRRNSLPRTLRWLAALSVLVVLAIAASVHADHKPNHKPGGGGGGPGGGDPANPAIAFTRGENFNKLMVMDANGKNATQIGQETSPYQDKSWSSSELSFAYALGQRSEVWRIDVVLNADGEPEGQNALLLGTDIFHPAWSPMADEIAVAGRLSPSGPREAIQIISAVTGDVLDTPYVAPAGHTVSDPTWSPNGLEIAFMERFGTLLYAIMVVDVATGIETKVLDEGLYTGPLASLDWARHNADLLAFSGRLAGSPDKASIHEFNLLTGEITKLSTGDDDNPTWSPDGTLIAFDRRRNGGNWDIWTVAVATPFSVSRLIRNGVFADWKK